MEVNTDGLPPEMQERIAQIIEGAKQKAAVAIQEGQVGVTHPAAQVGQVTPTPPPKNGVPRLAQRQPSLMDHTIQLRQEVAALSQQVTAMGQVVEACGQAVGAMYAMFQQQTTVTDPSATYSSQFQHEEYVEDNNDY